MLQVGEPQQLSFIGYPVDPTQTVLNVSPGWSWISYTPQTAMPLTSALSGWNAVAGETVKSQTRYVQYVEGIGWLGNLNQMEPGKMYMLYSAQGAPVSFTYPSGIRAAESMEPDRELTYQNFDSFFHKVYFQRVA